jgi:hypothetical protein
MSSHDDDQTIRDDGKRIPRHRTATSSASRSRTPRRSCPGRNPTVRPMRRTAETVERQDAAIKAVNLEHET